MIEQSGEKRVSERSHAEAAPVPAQGGDRRVRLPLPQAVSWQHGSNRETDERTRAADARPLKVLHISTVGNAGGAGRAAFRLHQGLLRLGHESLILTGHPVGLEPGVAHLRSAIADDSSFLASALDRIGGPMDQILGLGTWSWRNSWRIADLDVFRQADVVNVHNVHGGYLNVRALAHLARLKPLVWTLHDMWALTGHCAYAYGCERWEEGQGCHSCPLIRAEGRKIVEPAPTLIDRTRSIWNMKRRVYGSAALHVVAPSRWLEGLVHRSILRSALSIECIPYGIDLASFHPSDQQTARQELGLPADAKVVFFSSDRVQNQRKGAEYLYEALGRLKDRSSVWLLTSGDESGLESLNLPVHVRSLGYQRDERQQQVALAAADICVSPTLADNFPLVLMEAVACGTPAVAFDVGGVREIVQHFQTGYLARYQDTADLAHGMDLLLGDDGLRRRLAQAAREEAERDFPLDLAASRYCDVYRRALSIRGLSGVSS